MEFRKMVTITVYARQQKRHRCIEQSFGLCGRGWGWDDLWEWHWNMYNIIYETNCQSRFDAWYRMLRAGALGWPRGMVHPWQIHVDVWQNWYNIVISLQLKWINLYLKKNERKPGFNSFRKSSLYWQKKGEEKMHFRRENQTEENGKKKQ